MTTHPLVVTFLNLLVRDKWVGLGEGQFMTFPFFGDAVFFEVAPSDFDTNWPQAGRCDKISPCFISIWLPDERNPAQL